MCLVQRVYILGYVNAAFPPQIHRDHGRKRGEFLDIEWDAG